MLLTLNQRAVITFNRADDEMENRPHFSHKQDLLANEVPVALVYNGIFYNNS